LFVKLNNEWWVFTHHSLNYLSGAMLVQNNGVDSLYYTYTDNQGSLIALTDASGNVVRKYAYDPWGARRNASDWTQKDNGSNLITNRGYTGHEHLDAFGIINMNGRVYDPATGMFFSPDPNLQSPGDWVNYNRYSYCMGNPLKYTDPSGYTWDGNPGDAAAQGTGVTNEDWLNYWTIRRMAEQSAGAAYEMRRWPMLRIATCRMV
jgi:RHS repeat-associated protein